MLREALTLRSFIKTPIRYSHGVDQTDSRARLDNYQLQCWKGHEKFMATCWQARCSGWLCTNKAWPVQTSWPPMSGSQQSHAPPSVILKSHVSCCWPANCDDKHMKEIVLVCIDFTLSYSWIYLVFSPFHLYCIVLWGFIIYAVKGSGQTVYKIMCFFLIALGGLDPCGQFMKNRCLMEFFFITHYGSL